MRWMLSAGLAVAAIMGATSAQAAVDPALLIVPGRSVGPITLGCKYSEVERLLGAPSERTYLDPDHILAQWQKAALVVAVENDHVVLVATSSRRYQTSNGLHVGLPGSAASDVFPSMTPPSARGVWGLGSEDAGVNFIYHPSAATDMASGTLPVDWTIDEINVFAPIIRGDAGK